MSPSARRSRKSASRAQGKSSLPRSHERKHPTRRSRARQLTLDLPSAHGGRRKGAGRPQRADRAGFKSHVTRETFTAREPLHVTVKLARGRPNLRRRDVHKALKKAVAKARLKGLRVVHYALLANHAHFIVEATDRHALARQMQSLGISFAKRLQWVTRRMGQVWLARYYVSVLRTPTQVKRAIAYVVTNEHKHQGSQGRIDLDEYSSAHSLSDSTWGALLGRAWQRVVGFPPDIGSIEEQELRRAIPLERPRSWLLSAGWVRARDSGRMSA